MKNIFLHFWNFYVFFAICIFAIFKVIYNFKIKFELSYLTCLFRKQTALFMASGLSMIMSNLVYVKCGNKLTSRWIVLIIGIQIKVRYESMLN